MNFTGIVIGLATLMIIGIFHPIVIKAEYQWGKGCWPFFAATGILCCVLSLYVKSTIPSALLGLLAFSLFWSILELFEQEKRVQKGWYPCKGGKKKYNGK